MYKPIEPSRISQGLYVRIVQNVINAMRATKAYDIQKLVKLSNNAVLDPDATLKEAISMLKTTKNKVITINKERENRYDSI